MRAAERRETSMTSSDPAVSIAPGPPVSIVCLDLGGVVVRIRRSFAEALRAAGAPEGLFESLAPDAVARVAAESALHQRGEIGFDAWLARTHRALGERVERGLLARAHDAVIVGEYPGVAAAIGRLRRAGARTACLSNTNDRHWEAMLPMPALAAIEHRHASHLLGLEKPGEAIYRAFERAVGARPGEILFLDDLPENCAAARRCGWHAVEIDHERDTPDQIIAAARAHGVGC